MSANNMTAFVPQRWSKRVLTKIDRTNIALRIANRDYEGDIRESGDTVWVRTYGNVTTSPYTRGGPIDYGALSPTKESLTIDDAQNFAFSIDDLDDAQMDLKALDGYTDRAAVAVNNLVEDKIQAQYVFAPAANRVTGAAGAALTIDDTNAYTTLVEAGLRLDNQDVKGMDRWAFVTPEYKAALAKDTKYFIRATDLGDTIIKTGSNGSTARNTPGFIGQAAGFDLYLSTATPQDATSRFCMFGAGKPVSYAGQIRKIERIRRESTWGTAVRGLILHGATVFAEHSKMLGYVRVAKPA